MTFRTAILPAIRAIRTIAGPSGLDVELSQLTIRTRTWIGGIRGSDAGVIVSDLVLPMVYDLVGVTAAQIASSGGRYEMGDIKIGPIDPPSTGGGYSRAQLKPNSSPGVDIVYLITGHNSGEYICLDLDTDDWSGYYLVLRRMRTTP